MATQEWGLRTLKRRRSGGTPPALSCVYGMFTNPFYAGVILRDGRTYPGKHQALVTLDEFDRVQELLGRPGRPRRKTHEFAFTGMIRCGECGFFVTAETKTNRYGSVYTYYHCSKRRLDYRCRQPYLPSRDLEAQLNAFLRSLSVPEPIHRWAMRRLDRSSRERASLRDTQRQSVEQAEASLERQRVNLTRLRVRDLLTDEEYARERAELDRERIRVTQRTEDLDRSYEQFEPERLLVSFSNQAASRFSKGDERIKRSILELVGSNFSLTDRQLLLEAKTPFRQWTGTAKHSDWWAFVEDVRTFAGDPANRATFARIRAILPELDQPAKAA